MKPSAKIPDIPKKKNGLPILSNKQIDDLADELVSQFCPDVFIHPHEIDLDNFIEKFLGFDLDILYLSHCGCYLGATIFQDLKFPIFNIETFKPELTNIPANTIIVDAVLFQQMENSGNEGRYRFTLAHECGHAVMHPDFYRYQSSAIQNAEHQLAAYSTGRKSVSPYSEVDNSELAEQQANKFASCLLMPRRAVEKLIHDRHALHWEDYDLILLVKETFNTSWESAFYRLKDLGYMEAGEYDWKSLGY